jgi:predicted NAD/FAD-dependent oxidoreductase
VFSPALTDTSPRAMVIKMTPHWSLSFVKAARLDPVVALRAE